MIRQIPLCDWISLDPEIAICQLPITVTEARERFGLSFELAEPQLLFTGYALVEVDGRRLLLSGVEEAVMPEARLVYVAVDSSWRDPAAALPIVCASFGVAEADLPWVAPSLSPRRWCLERLDDNGNKFVMGYFDTKERAVRVASYFQAKGHRQLYEAREVV